MKLKSGRRVVFRRERYILVGLLACMFLCSVGYAILSQQIKINGISSISTNFDIYIESITENSLTNAETVGEPSITNKTSGRIEVNLNEKGAKAIYDVTVRNAGNVDALITAIEGIEEANQQEPIDITVSTSGLQLYSPLLQGETMTFQIVVMWDSSITTTSSAENKTIDFTVEYQQKTADSPTPLPDLSGTYSSTVDVAIWPDVKLRVYYTVTKDMDTGVATVTYRSGNVLNGPINGYMGTSALIIISAENQRKTFYMMWNPGQQLHMPYGVSGDIVVTHNIDMYATEDSWTFTSTLGSKEATYTANISWENSDLK